MALKHVSVMNYFRAKVAENDTYMKDYGNLIAMYHPGNTYRIFVECPESSEFDHTVVSARLADGTISASSANLTTQTDYKNMLDMYIANYLDA